MYYKNKLIYKLLILAIYSMLNIGLCPLRAVSNSLEVLNTIKYNSFIVADVSNSINLNDVTIKKAIDNIGKQNKEISLSPGKYIISNNLTIPKNIILKITSGTTLSITNNATLTINSSFTPEYKQVFEVINGNVNFGPGTIKEIPVIWFGAIPTDNLDDSVAIQSAINTAEFTSDMEVVFLDGKYDISKTIKINKNNNPVKLKAKGHVVLNWLGGDSDLLYIGNESGHGILKATVEDFHFHGTTSKGTAIHLVQAAYSRLLGNEITGFNKGIFIDGSIGTIINGKWKAIFNNVQGICIRSNNKNTPLRFAVNLTEITNVYFGNNSDTSINMSDGNVAPAGSGGLLDINHNVFEGIKRGANGIYLDSAYETKSNNFIRQNAKIRDNWFEQFGDTAIILNDTNATIENNFFVGAGLFYIHVSGESSRIYATQNSTYGVDVHPANNFFIFFNGITPQNTAQSVIINNYIDCPARNY